MLEKGKSLKLRKEIFSWAKYLSCAVLVSLLVNHCLIVNATVESGSMENTVMTGDRVFCNRLAYLNSDPQRFDIIIFDFEEWQEEKMFFKRIIGLPNEKVEIKDGNVYINDALEPLQQDFVKGTPRGNFGPFYVPEDHYFLLGDNRNDSFDSKSWENPYIARDKILGKAVLNYYPKLHLIETVEQ